MKKLFYLLPVLMLTFSCEKDDPVEPNDEELITTLRLELTSGSSTKTLLFQDIDGDGGNAPSITTDTLDANTTYSVALFLLNESITPAESINPEIIEEGDEHQFFFQTSNGLLLSSSYEDTDDNGQPIGLLNTFTTSTASDGNLNVILRHQPNKTASNVAAGDITNAGGETDIEVLFDVVVQ